VYISVDLISFRASSARGRISLWRNRASPRGFYKRGFACREGGGGGGEKEHNKQGGRVRERERISAVNRRCGKRLRSEARPGPSRIKIGDVEGWGGEGEGTARVANLIWISKALPFGVAVSRIEKRSGSAECHTFSGNVERSARI